MTFHEINQTIKSHQAQKLKYSDLLNRYNEFEAKYKQSEIFYKNQIEDLKSSITEQVEENTDKLNAEHNAEVKILKNEILTCKLEMEELHQKKIYQVSELEKRVLELDATINIIKRQEDLVKTLEHSIEAKDLKIKNNEREVSRLNQRIEDLLAQIKKLKSTINSSETHAKF